MEKRLKKDKKRFKTDDKKIVKKKVKKWNL
jgi:hypothetical protein